MICALRTQKSPPRRRARGLSACWAILLLLPVLASCSSGDDAPAPGSGDYVGLRTPTQPYGSMVERVFAFLTSDVGEGGIREDDGLPVPPYFYSLGILDGGVQLTDPVSFPAYTCAMAIAAFTRYYVYTGDEEAVARAVAFADWVLRHLTPDEDLLSRFPYSTQAFGAMGGGEDGPSIELDKAAMFALALLGLHDTVGDPRYEEAARHIAAVLLGQQKEDGSWPFRVIPSSGEVYRDYTSDQIPFVLLMERTFASTGEAAYREAGERAWAWILENPVRTKWWANFYEDMDDPDSLVNVDTLETIHALVERREEDPGYLAMALDNFRWIERTHLLLGAPYPPRIPTIAEQTGFVLEGVLAGTSSSTAQWAARGLDLYGATGNLDILVHAIEAANVVASSQQDDGRMFTVTADAHGSDLYPISWYEQCFVPLAFMLEIMGKLPETAPADEDHMLQHTAPIQDILYEPYRIAYTTAASGQEILKVSKSVGEVRAGGVALPVGIGPADQPGWALNPNTRLLRVQHTHPEVEVLLED